MENSIDHEYEILLTDVVKISIQEISKRKKVMNWMIAMTVAVLYLIISILSQKWEITWVIWIIYCLYRILTEYIM